MPPKISIVVPNYNLGNFLSRTLLSVVEQDYSNKEIIVIDGASTDNSPDVIDSFRDRLDVVVIEPDNGHAEALNKGFALATGDIMCWVNSDDILMPHALRSAANVFDENPQVHWIVGNTTLIAEDDTIIRSSPPRSHSRIRFLSGDYRWVQQESCFWSREIWERSGAFIDETYQLAIDLELWLRFFEHGRLYPVETALGAFRTRAGQRSQSQLEAYYQETERAILHHRSNISDAYKKFFSKALNRPLDVRRRPDLQTLGPKIAAEDVPVIQYQHDLARFISPSKENFSPHLKRKCAPPETKTPEPVTDIIDTLPASAFLPHRFRTFGDDLSKFRGKHKGEQCVVLGNGPSLNKMDLSVFDRSTILAANSIFLLFNRVNWRPKYYSCVDTRVLPDIRQDITDMLLANPEMTAFLPSELHVYDGSGRTVNSRELVPKTSQFHFFRQKYVDRDNLPFGTFSLDMNDFLYVPNTVTITLMQIAAYLGFSEIVLAGCDTSYTIPKTAAQTGPSIGNQEKLLLTSTEDDDPNHFDPAYFGKGRAWHNPKVEDMIWHYQQAKQVLDAQGIRVVNATVGGNLEVFPRAHYHDVIK